MAESLEIERLEANDWLRFRRIRLASLADAPDAFGSRLTDVQTRPEAYWRAQPETLATFVAVVDGKDAGVVRGAPHHTNRDQAILISMWVAPAFRQCGVGLALVRSVIGWARDEGYATLLLDVADQNQAAIGLYERAGFRPTGATGTLPAPREHILEHERALSLQKH